MIKKEKLHSGDIIYTEDKSTRTLYSGVIKELKDDKAVVESRCFVHEDGSPGYQIIGTTNVFYENMWDSINAGWNAIRESYRKPQNHYYNSIQTIEDLIRFPLNHSLTGTLFTDYEAREAYIQKAKELLDFKE